MGERPAYRFVRTILKTVGPPIRPGGSIPGAARPATTRRDRRTHHHDARGALIATVDYFLSGDPEVAKQHLHAALQEQGFTVTTRPTGQWAAERGSKQKTFWLGAFAGKAQHLVFTVDFMVHGDQLVARIDRPTGHGAMAGAVGVARSNKAFGEVDQAIGTRLTQHGILANVVHA